jgi:putative intracellular protease/amidase
MNTERREFLRQLTCVLPGLAALAQTTSAQAAPEEPKPAHDMSAMPPGWMGHEVIVQVLYPQFTALDLIGPHYFLSSLMGAKVLLAAKSMELVSSDSGVKIMPDITFADCPAALDLLCVPGGTTGTLAAMQDAETMAFIRKAGAAAKVVSSVCTGSLILGAAGLLKGRKATSHWLVKDLLHHFGATVSNDRVVEDGKVVTAAGVTAGMDFGLHMSLKWRDREYTDCLALLAEYDPHPPTTAGDPAKAPAKTRQLMVEMLAGFHQKVEAIGKGR